MNRVNRDDRAFVALRRAITLAIIPASTAPANGDAKKAIPAADVNRSPQTTIEGMMVTIGGSRTAMTTGGHDHKRTFGQSGLIGSRPSPHSGQRKRSALGIASDVTSYPHWRHLRVATQET